MHEPAEPSVSKIIRGQGFYPGSSQMIDAELRLTGDGRLSLWDSQSGARLLSCESASAQLDNNAGGSGRRVTLEGGWLFLTDDEDVLSLVRERKEYTLLRKLEEYRPRLIGICFAAIVAVWVLWKYGLTVLVAIAVFMTPDVVRTTMDAGTIKTLDYVMAEPSTLNENAQREMQAIFKKVSAQLEERDRRTINLQFRDMPGLGPNALALPGGTVILTDELVEQFGEDDDLIAGIIGHELAHYTQDHGLKQLYRSLSVYILIALIAGDVGPVLEDIALEGQLLLRLSYSREHEDDADMIGVRLSHAAGYNPRGLIRFFDAFKNFETHSEWYSTHPLSEHRIENIEGVIEGL